MTTRTRGRLTIRVTDAFSDQIKNAAAVSGRSMSEEMEFRLEMSFRDERKSPDKVQPSALVPDDILLALQAIADGYEGSVNHGFIIVENPDASPEALALRGVDPKLVINAKYLLAKLTSGQRSKEGVNK